MGRLDELDLSLKLSREEEAARLEAASNRLLELRLTLGGLLGDGRLGPPVCVLFEGWDASGKGGAIRRLVNPMDPRHVRVATFAAPTYDEKRHHFLWRFWSSLPGWGGMAVLDRSWYGRVLVERVEGFATVEQWTRGYDEIVEYERSLAPDRERFQALRQGQGGGDGDPRDRAGHARPRLRAARAPAPAAGQDQHQGQAQGQGTGRQGARQGRLSR
jgi:polyphosphate kinase 2 (PPK2 family)